MFIDRAQADTVQNTSDYWATTGRLLADTVGFTSSRRPLWWYLRSVRNREDESIVNIKKSGGDYW